MTTNFHRSPAHTFARPAFGDVRAVVASATVDGAELRRLIPPPLELVDDRITISIADTGSSNCVGPFKGASISAPCAFGDSVGAYCLSMPVDSGPALVFGRELYGEPKKMARVEFERTARGVESLVERFGRIIASFRLDFAASSLRSQDQVLESRAFHFRYRPDPGGNGLSEPVELVGVDVTRHVTATARGEVDLSMGCGSPHDLAFELPLASVGGGTYVESSAITTATTLATVDREPFEPYAWLGSDAYGDNLAP